MSEWMGVSGEQRVMDQRRLIWRAWAPLLHHCSTLHPYQQLLPCASCIMRPTKILVNECNCMPKEVPTWEGGHEQALQVLGPARIALIRLNVVQLQAAVAGRQAWWQTIRGSRISSSRGAAVISGVAG